MSCGEPSGGEPVRERVVANLLGAAADGCKPWPAVAMERLLAMASEWLAVSAAIASERLAETAVMVSE